MLRELAAESIYKERCVAVDDGPTWAKYMSVYGSPDDEYDIITLQYTEEGLLTIDDNRKAVSLPLETTLPSSALQPSSRERFTCLFGGRSGGVPDKASKVGRREAL